MISDNRKVSGPSNFVIKKRSPHEAQARQVRRLARNEQAAYESSLRQIPSEDLGRQTSFQPSDFQNPTEENSRTDAPEAGAGASNTGAASEPASETQPSRALLRRRRLDRVERSARNLNALYNELALPPSYPQAIKKEEPPAYGTLPPRYTEQNEVI